MASSAKPAEVTGQSIANVRLFECLSLAQRDRVARELKGLRFPAGVQIVSHKDSARDVFALVSGRVRVTFYSLSGREVSFRELDAGDSFGEISAIDGEPRSATVVSLEDAFVVIMAEPVFQKILDEHPCVSRAVMSSLSFLVRRLSERVVEFSTLGVNNRIHAELLRLALAGKVIDNTAEISPVPTQFDIANRISTRREAVTREIANLTRSGLIERTKGTLSVCDLGKLRRMVHDVSGE